MQTIVEHLGIILVFLGAVLSAVGGGVLYVQQNRAENRMYGAVLGGDSFCYLDMVAVGPNSVAVILRHRGQCPVYDLEILVRDTTKMLGMMRTIPETPLGSVLKNGSSFEPIDAATATTIRIGTVPVGTERRLGVYELREPDAHDFNVTLAARNGVLSEYVRLRRKGPDEAWLAALKVVKEGELQPSGRLPETVRLQQIAPDYPASPKW